MNTREKFLPIRKGLLEFVLLNVVAGEKLYVAEMLKRLAVTDFATQEGTLYPLLSRMRREELVDYEWQESESGPPRKYYKLTATGQRTLQELRDYWQQINSTITELGEMTMLKVVTANLNGNAYQIDETGFEALRGYLETARAGLAHNPDCVEILTDLEQAIGDKCDTFLGQHKNVVSEAEMAQILREMGPVESAPDPAAAAAAETSGEAQTTTAAVAPVQPAPIRRLFRLPEKGMLGGVCAGIAAYFNVDVVWIRLLFVLLTLVTGFWLLVWLVALFVMPRAVTPEDVALAHGAPFNAQDVINRAKKSMTNSEVNTNPPSGAPPLI